MVRRFGGISFEKNQKAYHTFLTRFLQKPYFNNECLGNALEHAYKVSIKKNLTLPDSDKMTLSRLILEHKKKVIKDLNALKASPGAALEPLDSVIVSGKRKPKNFTNVITFGSDKKRKIDDDLTNIICKKLKLSTPEKEDIRCTINDWKERYLERHGNKSKALSLNENLKEVLNISIKEGDKSRFKERRIPIVLLESNRKLQEMARKLQARKKSEEKENSDMDKENYDDNNHWEHYRQIDEAKRETESKPEHSIIILRNLIDNENEILEENVDSSYTENTTVFIKEEVNLLDDPVKMCTSTPSVTKYKSYFDRKNDRNESSCSNGDSPSKIARRDLNSSTPLIYRHGLESMSSTLPPSYCNNNFVYEQPYRDENYCRHARDPLANYCSECRNKRVMPAHNSGNLIEQSNYCGLYDQYMYTSFRQHSMYPYRNYEIASELYYTHRNPVYNHFGPFGDFGTCRQSPADDYLF